MDNLPIEIETDEEHASGKQADVPTWLKCGKIMLTIRDKSILTSGRKFTDVHVRAAQFSHLAGLSYKQHAV